MATLRVTHTEDILLEGRQQGNTRTMRFDNITDVFSRVFSFAQGVLTTLYTTHTNTISGGVFDDGSIKYVRMTNLGNEPIAINVLLATSNHAFAYEVQPNESYYLYSHSVSGFTDTADAITVAELGGSLVNVSSVKAYCHRAAAKIEVFVASIDAK